VHYADIVTSTQQSRDNERENAFLFFFHEKLAMKLMIAPWQRPQIFLSHLREAD